MDMAEDLKSERLSLRLLHSEEDGEEFFALVKHDRKALGQWLPWVETMRNLDACMAFLDASEIQAGMSNGGLWGLFAPQGLIGTVALHWIQWDHLSASIGYWLDSKHQGNGYAREGVARLVQYSFEDLGLHRVEASVAVNNLRSAHLLLSLGFQREGLRRHAERLHGEFLDHGAFAILQSDGYTGNHFPTV